MPTESPSKKSVHRKLGNNAIALAILAAFLYGISAPFSKLLLTEMPPTLMAGLLYLGAGMGMLFWNVLRKRNKEKEREAKLTRKDTPYVIAMVALDVAAPIALLTGLAFTPAENVSLLNNFEIVATGLLAFFFFKEAIGRRMALAIILITLASILLSIENENSFSFSVGSLLVIAACLCWGLENNCTRMLSLKDPLQIVVIKGFGAGTTAMVIFVLGGGSIPLSMFLIYGLMLGFVSYGLSIYFYILAQRHLGAARTSAYYAAAPFIGVLVSWLLFQEPITSTFAAALAVMILGTYLAITEKHKHLHHHEPLIHSHLHDHQDSHHQHDSMQGTHSHMHTHEPISHVHKHTPDLHHVHSHGGQPDNSNNSIQGSHKRPKNN